MIPHAPAACLIATLPFAPLAVRAQTQPAPSYGQDDAYPVWPADGCSFWGNQGTLLVFQPGGTGPPVWEASLPESYEPVLRAMPWTLHGHPVLLLQFQYGAAGARTELYAVQPRSTPAMLGSVESFNLQDAPRCCGWDGPAAKLSMRPC